jgi:Cof subfamily protein (haloacid dehalogenase superfamily)
MTRIPRRGRPRGIFITDFDGTLRSASGTIAERDRQTLRTLGERGYLRVIATGRSLYSLGRAIDDELSVDYIVFSSGAGILDFREQKIIRKVNLKGEEVSRAVEFLLELEADFMIHEPIPDNHRFLYFSTGLENPDFSSRCELYKEHCRPFEGDPTALGPGAQVLTIEPPGVFPTNLKAIQQRLPQCSIIRTTSPLDGVSTWIEIFPKGVSKGRSTAWLAEQHGLGPQSALSVGNDYNDADLLEWTRYSFVMANAPAELKRRFEEVSSSDECGVSEAVERWLCERSG